MYDDNNPDPLWLDIILKKVKGENAIENQHFPFQLSYEDYSEIIKKLFPIGDEIYRIEEIYNNFGIEFLNEKKQMMTNLGYLRKETDINNLTKFDVGAFNTIQIQIQDINAFATASEVKALTEIVTNDLKEIFSLVISGKYHFYNGSSIKNQDFVQNIADFKNIEDFVGYDECCNEYFLDDYMSFLKLFAKYGYFQTSTGVIYIKPNTKLYKKVKSKYDNKTGEIEEFMQEIWKKYI